MEYLPFGDLKLLKELPVTTAKRIFTNTLRSMGVNAFEEGTTELVNILYDTLVNGDISNWQQSVDSYMADGMSENEAKNKTLADMASQVGQAMTSGAIGGGIPSLGAQTLGYVNNRSTSHVFNAAYRSGSTKIAALADSLYGKMRQGKANSFDIANLQNDVNYYHSLNDTQKLAYDLEPSVMDGTASLAEQMAYKISSGETLTTAELNRLNNDHDAVPALGRLLGLNLNGMNYSIMTPTLNSTAKRNAKYNAKLKTLQKQYQQRTAEIEAARAQEQERQAEIQRQQEQTDSTKILDSKPHEIYNNSRGARNTDVGDNELESTVSNTSVDVEEIESSKYAIKNHLVNSINEIRAQMPNSNLAKRGNMAVADVNITGIKGIFVAHSKINGKSDKGADVADFSYLKSEDERIFTTYVDDIYPRYHDTEAKILEDIAAQITDENASGTIYLYSELPCCQSCSNIILEFRRIYPNIKLNVIVE